MKYFIHLPMKMEPIVSSETSAIRTQTPGNYPKRNNLLLQICYKTSYKLSIGWACWNVAHTSYKFLSYSSSTCLSSFHTHARARTHARTHAYVYIYIYIYIYMLTHTLIAPHTVYFTRFLSSKLCYIPFSLCTLYEQYSILTMI